MKSSAIITPNPSLSEGKSTVPRNSASKQSSWNFIQVYMITNPMNALSTYALSFLTKRA